MKAEFTIDTAKCINCGKCASECADHVKIQGTNHVIPNNPRCGGCFHCYTICPRNAIKPVDIQSDTEYSEDLLLAMDTDLLKHFLACRRSIRRFEDRPVGEALVNRLIQCARYIPSGGNAHSYEFTVVPNGQTRQKLLAELRKIYEKRSVLLNNPIIRILARPFVDKQSRGFLKSREYGLRMKNLLARIQRGEDPFFYNAPVVIVIHSKAQIPTPKEDCILAGYNINLMAQTFGLGACFVTLAQNAFNTSNNCKELLGLSPADNVYAVVILGYPKVKHLRISPKPETTAHWVN